MYDYLNVIDEKKAFLKEVADNIWDNPELCYEEFKSAQFLIDALKKEGFEVTENVAGIKTAFSGSFGSGKPVIGVLGEFDALSGLGQVSGCMEKTPDGHSNGHGCGHNLLGVGSLAAAIAIKEYLKTSGKSGTVIYFGTPAEEGGSGKAFMAGAGAFDCLDFALCWHPSDNTYVRTESSLSNFQVLYKFDGVAAHAGGKPHMGRSALDAVELMDVGVNYLREHIIPEARVHYAILDTGGISPNVVQPHAEVLYLIRAPQVSQLKDIYERVNNIAEGAALMTGTKASRDFIKGCSNLVMNRTIQLKMQDVAGRIPQYPITDEMMDFAKKLQESSMKGYPDADFERPIYNKLRDYDESKPTGFGSTDVGDASWVCPTAQMYASTWVKGTPGHSWQATAQGKGELAINMTLWTGKVLAQTAIELLEDPELLQKAKDEHKERIGKDGYICPIPKGLKPRSISSLTKK